MKVHTVLDTSKKVAVEVNAEKARAKKFSTSCFEASNAIECWWYVLYSLSSRP
jgi:hypothetical protein